ncbi:MAG: tRNA epoxyqueuosine(34) reductase QueG [Saprospiraceae bacterium]|nr:tRNA epoxyqueuosine(34) reductase QueG [Saprospiraceae bacterium]
MDKYAFTELFRTKASEMGFLEVGVAKAEFMEEEAYRLEQWLNNNHHGQMSYLENYFDKRVDPTKLVPGAKSVISLAYNYYSAAKQTDKHSPKIAMYALGKDYHKVVKKKLLLLFNWMQSVIGDINGRCFVDSAPVLERDWAKRSGLGWIGKNTMLIHPKHGSYFFLAEIITDIEMVYDQPIKDYCGTCTRCIDACPTEAISQEGYLMDGSKCISYATIELKNSIPEEFKDKMGNWMFGCDICQQVCPWNRFSEPHSEPAFMPQESLLKMTKEEWVDLSEPVFNQIFEGSAVKRTKYEGLKRNIEFLNNG